MAVHGGDIYRNHVDIDFSVSVNPLGIPKSVKEALLRSVEMCDRYPDIEAERLKEAVSGMLGIKRDMLLFGNGASELFMAAVHAVKPKKIVIPVPSFYGYEYAAGAAECEVFYYETKQENHFRLTEGFIEILTEDTDLLFLANPNNPTGTLLGREEMKDILRRCQKRGIYVVLDECFIEFCGGSHSMLPEIGSFDNVILVRAFTKIFSIPGVRLGFLICNNQALLEKIAGQIPEWNLSCFAQASGIACAEQAGFIEETKTYIGKERQFLEEGFGQKGYQVYPSMANFILIYSEMPLYEKLLQKGILIRDCKNFRGLHQGFYRIAVRSRKENEILLRNCERINLYRS